MIVISESGTEDDEYDEFLSNPSDSEDYAYTSPIRSREDLRQTQAANHPLSGDEANRAGSS